MPTLAETLRTQCERCHSEQREEVVYVLDADERRDLVRRCLTDRIRKIVCNACGDTVSYDLPLLVYRPSDGGLSALIWVKGNSRQDTEDPGQVPDLTRLTAWLYHELRLTFADHEPGWLPANLDGLAALLCRSVEADLAAAYVEDIPGVDAYREMLGRIRAERASDTAISR